MIVALGILAIMMVFASAIFRISINSQRLAVANGEIMQKLRVITEQLDADFRGFLPQYGGEVINRTIQREPADPNITLDSIAFFANGDFQSTKPYGDDPHTIVGNVASILYSPPDSNSYGSKGLPAPKDRLLLRRQTILIPLDANDNKLRAQSSWDGEYCCSSLEEWRSNPPYAKASDWVRCPSIDANDLTKCLPMYLTQGVDNFTISYLALNSQWQTGEIPWRRSSAKESSGTIPVPRAVKFEFTLYDSKGLIRNGRTFTHIVLLDR
jgi:hypothetical protein